MGSDANNIDISTSEIPEKKIPYPKSVFFIISNEFCERFSYYGMKTILVLYFRDVLQYSENTSTMAFHIFSMACYFTPVIGAIIADSLLGKFLTILSISIVYAAGNIVLSFASINGTSWATVLGLSLIAFGTGGIKPCVSAFGGDQFVEPQQKEYLKQFFSLFYVSINAGSLISTFVSPILRQDVTCFDRADCYPAAFGLPALLMAISVGFFIGGHYITRYKIIPPQKDNLMIRVCKCVCHALGVRLFGNSTWKRDHWLDYADDRYDQKTIKDVKALMSVLLLYLPLPIFWSLFDQQGSRWTLQAIRMNGKLGGWTIKPDQIQVVNPLLVIAMIPVFEYFIYPVLIKINMFHRPLQRMTIGGILAAISFFICALMQLKIEQENPESLHSGNNHVMLLNDPNLSQCNFTIENAFYNGTIDDYVLVENVPKHYLTEFKATFTFENNHSDVVNQCPNGQFLVKTSISTKNDKSVVLFLSRKLFKSYQIDWVCFSNFLVKPEEGGALIFTVFNIDGLGNEKFEMTDYTDPLLANVTTSEGNRKFGYIKKFEVAIKGDDLFMSVGRNKSKKYLLDQGATYIQLITGDVNKELKFDTIRVVEGNKLSVFLQVIQYFVITCAEIMFSITGLEFSYSQAPKSMKSVLQACWLLTVAIGNLIIAIIADLTIFDNQSTEFFFFSALMLVDIAVFALIAYYYVPYQGCDDDDDDEKIEKKR